jgi:hypothetical protein
MSASTRHSTGMSVKGVAAIALIVGLIIGGVVVGLTVSNNGNSATPPAARAVVAAVPPATATPATPITLPTMRGAKGITGTALLTPLGGTSMKLAITTVSGLESLVQLWTSTRHHEDWLLARPGRYVISRRVTLQHLLSFTYLRVWVVRPQRGGQASPVLEIRTPDLAQGVVAQSG